MDVRAQREAGIGVPEPALHLHGVPASREQARSARVSERVKPGPRDAGLLGRWLELAHEEVGGVQRLAGRAREQESPRVRLTRGRFPESQQLV